MLSASPKTACVHCPSPLFFAQGKAGEADARADICTRQAHPEGWRSEDALPKFYIGRRSIQAQVAGTGGATRLRNSTA